VTADEKLDLISQTVTDTRLAVATLHGEVRTSMTRLDSHDAARADFEARIRTLERRSWALPSAATLLGVAGLIVSVIAMLRT
jgi:hypothetical protein